MYPRTIEVRNEREAVAVEQALAMVRTLERIADDAPDGHVLAAVEQAAVEHGRRFTRDRLQDALNAQAAALEQRGGAAGPAPAADGDAIRGGPNAGSSPSPAT
jgi:hypothetical protein